MGVLTKYLKKAFVQNSFVSTSTDPKIKPSMLGSACMRKIYYSYNRVPEESKIPLKNRRIMALGNKIGDLLYEQFVDVAIDYVDEDGNIPMKFGKPNPEFPVSSKDLDIKKGYMDLVCVIDGKLWLGEFKSAGHRSYTDAAKVKNNHAVQAVTYLYLFNKMLKEGAYKHIKALDGFEKAEGIAVLYFNRDNTSIKDFEITEASNFFASIVQRIMQVKQYTKDNELPPKTYDWCNSCPYKDRCDKNINK